MPLPLGRDSETGRYKTNGWGQLRFAHGLSAALDLAQDRDRGIEVFADWDPEELTRAW